MAIKATTPTIWVPNGACDCHVHVFGSLEKYLPVDGRGYTPRPATPSDLYATLDAAGVRHVVLVQPSAYGSDNSCMLDALRGDRGGRMRGVAVLNDEIDDAELDLMNSLGVRGARVNLASRGAGPKEKAAEVIEFVANKIARFGWHLQIYAGLSIIAAQAKLIRRLPVEVVFDHMGRPDAKLGIGQPGFDELLELMSTGRAWVKLSGEYHNSPDEMGNQDVKRIARTLVDANPDRVLWGSDWPHLGKHVMEADGTPPPAIYRAIDYGLLLSNLGNWAVETSQIERILVSNPRALYQLPS